MALTTDVFLAFTSSTGYTFNAAVTEFVAGVARLKNSAGVANDTIQTPDIDRSAWTDSGSGIAIHKTTLTITEKDGYFHKFLVSFDVGRTWKTHNAGGWFIASLGDISTRGIGITELQGVRDWETTSQIRFAIYMERKTGGGDGDIDLITMHYGNTTTSMSGTVTPDAWPADPDNAGNLLVPDAIAVRHPIFYRRSWRSEFGYEIAVSTATKSRDGWDLTWTGLSLAQKDDLVQFLLDHQEDHITWQPTGNAAAIRLVAGEPRVDATGPDGRGYSVRCPCTEAFAEEVSNL